MPFPFKRICEDDGKDMKKDASLKGPAMTGTHTQAVPFMFSEKSFSYAFHEGKRGYWRPVLFPMRTNAHIMVAVFDMVKRDALWSPCALWFKKRNAIPLPYMA